MKNNEIVITAVGKNRASILSEITSLIGKLNGNIMDISQKIVKDYFNLIMIVDISKSNVSFFNLKEKLEALGDLKGYKITAQHKKVFQYMHRI